MLFKKIVITLILTLLVVSCSHRTKHFNSSVVEFLYPDKVDPVESPQIPRLSLPLKVGVAFVPSQMDYQQNFTEQSKQVLMREVSENFKKYPFVKSIEIIPSAYLKPQGSFANIDQLHSMFGVDVVALLSYDQTQFNDRGLASITYWTLVGAYIVQGEKNDTHTMLDAAVYHIPSRKMLFRAPGISHIKSSATPVNLSEQQRIDSMAGFKEASADLVVNLEGQLRLFQERVKESPEEFEVVHKPGYTGGGSLDAFFLFLIMMIGVSGVWLVKQQKK
jgi:rhombotail lipoprotein